MVKIDNIMKKVWEFIKKMFTFVLGLNFYGFGVLGVALILIIWVKGGFYSSIGLVLIGFFLGKNAQAIKAFFKSQKLDEF